MTHNVLMLLENAFINDARVEREISTLVKNGFKVLLVCWDRENKYPPEEYRYNSMLKIIRIKYPAARGKGLLYLIYKYLILNILFIKTSIRYEYQIIHSQNIETIFASAIIKLIKRKPLIYDAHEIIGIYHYRLFRAANILSSHVERILAKTADTVIVVTEGMAELFKQRGYKNKIVSIENYPIKDGFVLHDYSKNMKPVIIGRVGTISNFMNAELMVETVAEVRNRGYEVKLIFTGPIKSNYDKKFLTLIEEHKDFCEYHGQIHPSKVPEEYKKLDISLNIPDPVPEFKYGYASKLFEAMASGIPTIHTELGEIKNIFNDAGCGIIIEKFNKKNIVEAIESLVNDKDLRKKMGESGYNACVQKYNWGKVSVKLLDVYDNSLKKENILCVE